MSKPVDYRATVNGLGIHYVDWGTSGKQPLLLLHGIGREARTFDHVAVHLNSSHHAIAVDLRGHGDSDWDAQGAYLVEDYVRDVEALVKQLGLRNIILWGNSTGGRVAQVLAGVHPELVAAVICEDVGPERPTEVSNRRAERMSKEANGWDSPDGLLSHLRAQNPRTPEALLLAHAQHGSRLRADERIVLKRDPRIVEGFVPTELWRFVRQIKAPIIYILGGRSSIVPQETQQQLRQALPQAQIVTMPGLGHYPSDEDPAGFLEIVQQFLSGRKSDNSN
jgi:pimeloyl-ACP methyl ester carboxylesterase